MNCGIVFDIDDTLYLERDYVRSGFEAVGEHLDASLRIAGFANAAWSLFEEGVRGNTINRALSILGIDPTEQLIQELIGAYREHVPRIALLEDVRAAINTLASEGVPMGVITDGPAASQRAKASALGLHQSIQTIIFTDELGRGFSKPDPRSFVMIAAALGRPDRLTYVADNPAKDFKAPHGLGWRTWRLRRPGGLHLAQDSGPDIDLETDRITAKDLACFLN